jgi:hypothetical protein
MGLGFINDIRLSVFLFVSIICLLCFSINLYIPNKESQKTGTSVALVSLITCSCILLIMILMSIPDDYYYFTHGEYRTFGNTQRHAIIT